ncbi:MAG: serine/threonine protein kinase [Pyrinomonadaceae bacterium]|nr:serine/threonine protein kinase [Pyrinomonadaceae bacterium]
MIYSVFGLQLQANKRIPGLVEMSVAAGVDVQVWIEMVPPWLKEISEAAIELWYANSYQDRWGQPSLTVWRLADGEYFRLLYCDGTEFFIDRRGKEIWASWPDTMTLSDMTTYLLGPVMGFVLRLRGITCLHASAIAVNGQAIALLGPAGAGKSTTAAAFAGLGYPVLSDDVVALIDQGDTFGSQPGYPRLRLWPSSVDLLYGSAEALPRLTPTWDKRYLDLTLKGYCFQQQPLPLSAVYILGERRSDSVAPRVEDVSPQAGLITLISNTYTNYLLDKALRARELELLSRVVAHIPLRRVEPHADPAYLSRMCEVILDDFQALIPPAPASADAEQCQYV